MRSGGKIPHSPIIMTRVMLLASVFLRSCICGEMKTFLIVSVASVRHLLSVSSVSRDQGNILEREREELTEQTEAGFILNP